MKIIFLDIDGVLNSRQYDAVRGAGDGNIDTSRLPLLKELIDTTGAMVVLTTTWRRHWDADRSFSDEIGRQLEQTFASYGITLLDKTPEIDNDRAKEVASWLEAHNNVEAFVVFDDIKFGWGELDHSVVKTDYRIGRGLEKKHVEAAIKILNKAE